MAPLVEELFPYLCCAQQVYSRPLRPEGGYLSKSARKRARRRERQADFDTFRSARRATRDPQVREAEPCKGPDRRVRWAARLATHVQQTGAAEETEGLLPIQIPTSEEDGGSSDASVGTPGAVIARAVPPPLLVQALPEPGEEPSTAGQEPEHWREPIPTAEETDSGSDRDEYGIPRRKHPGCKGN